MSVLSKGQQKAQRTDPEEYLWPECVEFWEVWMQLQTQWRTGAAGATGLDYAGVRVWLDESTRFEGEERRELWQCIQACEHATLEGWTARREREDQRRAQQPAMPQIPGL